MRPGGQTLTGIQLQTELHATAIGTAVEQLPIQGARQTMKRRASCAHFLYSWRVTLNIAKPRPAHRHTTAHALPTQILCTVTQPNHGWLNDIREISENLPALLADIQLRLAKA